MSIFRSLALTLAVLAGASAHAQSERQPDAVAPAQLNTWFEEAGREFRVPPILLKSIAFAETRWTQVWRTQTDEHPALYTIMGLRQDEWFGDTLSKAAAAIGRDPRTLKNDTHSSIRAGAAWLSRLFSATGSRENPLLWTEAVKRYTGIPDDRDATSGASQIFLFASAGFEVIENRIRLAIAGTGQALPASLLEARDPSGDLETPSDRAELGITWDPSPNFDADAITPKNVIIHDTEGSFAGAVSWLKNPKVKASAHYIFRSADGFAKQLVREKDKAWHARCWNPFSIGIEHEGWMSKPQYFTDVMMRASASLTSKLTSDYNIPVDDTRVVGHGFWQSPKFPGSFLQKEAGNCNDHADPGRFWDWRKYFGFVAAAL